MRNLNKKVHFMGIGGSGMSGVALIASQKGFEVSGCDLEAETAYSEKLKKAGIKVSVGHDQNHLERVDILAVTPAAFYQSHEHPEFKNAEAKKILMTWQEFLGEYLQEGQKVICISGTHGKSTTTAMAGLLFENAKLDPSVLVGATVKAWNANFLVGKGNVFINEADEFFDNFLKYSPETIILNNIEFDHPDYFKNEEQVLESFQKFILRLKGDKSLIINQDSEGNKKLLSLIPEDRLGTINLVGYTLSNEPLIETKDSFKAVNIKLDQDSTSFRVVNEFRGFDEKFKIKLLGKYNVANSLGVIALGVINKIPVETIARAIGEFEGTGRRMELLAGNGGVLVYDDYAHHPTAIRETLAGLRQKYPKNKIWAIVEAHTYSRTKALLPLYKDAFKDADEIIIAPIFKSRDQETFGVSGDSIVKASEHKSARFINDFNKINDYLKAKVSEGDVVIVMGAGLSYKLARQIAKEL